MDRITMPERATFYQLPLTLTCGDEITGQS